MNNITNNNGHISTTAIGDVADDNDLVFSMTQKLTVTSGLPTECCIYRVPDILKAANEKAYAPQIVSIGPFHHGKANLQAMQDIKWVYLKSFLSRSSIANNSPSSSSIDIAYVRRLRHLEQRTRKSYSETFDMLSSNAFLEMMILDGCFIIELFIRHRMMMNNSRGREIVDGDAFFTTPRMHSYLVWDMILLENQLPLFVLEHLVSLNQLHHHKISQGLSSFLMELALDFFQCYLVQPKYYPDDHHQNLEISNHLLDLLRNCLLIPSRPSGHVTIDIVKDQQQVARSYIPCAKDLSFAGISIRMHMDDNLFNVKFENDKVLKIPPLRIAADLSNPLLPNLVAFEQCHSDCSTEFTSYAWLMLNIIKDADGVGFLSRRGIIKHLPGSEEELVLFFKKICSGVTLPRNFYFSELYNQLNRYFDRANRKYMYKLKTQYFDHPWTYITTVNAVIILMLALVQTFFTALPYIIKKHDS